MTYLPPLLEGDRATTFGKWACAPLPVRADAADKGIRNANPGKPDVSSAVHQKRGKPAPTGRVAILVMGVGRSGTSLLTRLLSRLGAALPQTLIGPSKGNERGHWEPAELVGLNDEILQEHGGSWCSPTPIASEWFLTERARDFSLRIAGVIEEEFGEAPLVVLKDPRLCRLAPLYFAALASLGMEPRIILPLRHPGEVVSSMAARWGISQQVAEGIWVRDLLDAEAWSRPHTRVWTSFNGLLSDWRATSANIGDALDIHWPNPPGLFSAEIESEFEPRLRHFNVERTPVPMEVSSLASSLWQAAQCALAGDDMSLREKFDAVRRNVPKNTPAPARDEPKKSEWKGERNIPALRGDIAMEHLHRYAIASKMVEGKSVLDIASGEGYGTNLLAENAHFVIGADFDDEAVRHARSKYLRPNLGFVKALRSAIPLADRCMDVVVSFDTLGCIAGHAEFLAEVCRVLRPGGIFIASLPAIANEASPAGANGIVQPGNPAAAGFSALLSGRFAHTMLLTQRVALGSYVASLDGAAQTIPVTQRGDFGRLENLPCLADGAFLIGVASNAPLPPVTAGLFEFGHLKNGRFVSPLETERAACKAARTEGDSAKASIIQLQNELADERARVAALRESVASAERWQRSWFRRAFHRWRPTKG